MLRRILIGVLAAVVLFGLIVATRPATFHVERSITMRAPAETVFAQVNDFHAWSAWSPWEKLDPQLKRSYDGPSAGQGAVYSWVGNDKVGEGRMTIMNAQKPALVAIKLEFIKPWAATNETTFTFVPTTPAAAAPGPAAETKVTWAMDGHNNFMAKAASIFIDMDSMVGGDFERGLVAMKTVAESAAHTSPETAATK